MMDVLNAEESVLYRQTRLVVGLNVWMTGLRVNNTRSDA